MKIMKGIILAGLLLSTGAQAQFPVTFVGGEMDAVTPEIKLLKVKQKKDGVIVKVRLSEEFTYCGECAAPLPLGYGQYPQVSQQGHVHVYMKRMGRIREERQADSFCAFNIFNPETVALGDNTFKSLCPTPERGRYHICAIVETDSHAQRVKAHPRDFPPIDCKVVRIK